MLALNTRLITQIGYFNYLMFNIFLFIHNIVITVLYSIKYANKYSSVTITPVTCFFSELYYVRVNIQPFYFIEIKTINEYYSLKFLRKQSVKFNFAAWFTHKDLSFILSEII